MPSSVRRVLFFVETPFNQRDYRRFGIQSLTRAGFACEVWDFTPVLYRESHESYAPPDPVRTGAVRVMRTKAGASTWLRTLGEGDFVFNNVHFAYGPLWIFRWLRRRRVPFAIFDINKLPPSTVASARSWLTVGSFPTKVRSLAAAVGRRIFAAVPFEWWGAAPAALAITSGNGARGAMPLYRFGATEVLDVHAMDYDLYLEERSRDATATGTAVFLDEDMIFHPEYLREGEEVPVTDEKYFGCLEAFFRRIEAALGVEVVIAVHPRAHVDLLAERFAGRRCVFGQSVRLVRESTVVICHSSTSVNFAVLFRKPVIFLTCTEFLASAVHGRIEAMAQELGKEPILMDRDQEVDFARELGVNDGEYHRYQITYIKTDGSLELPFWEIVVDHLRRQ